MVNSVSNYECLNTLAIHGTGPVTLITLATLGHFNEERFHKIDLHDRIEELQQEDVAWVPIVKTVESALGRLSADPALLDAHLSPNKRPAVQYQISPYGQQAGMPPAVTILEWWMRNPEFNPQKILGKGIRGMSVVFQRLNLLGTLCSTEGSVNEIKLRPKTGSTTSAFRLLTERLAAEGLIEIEDMESDNRILSCAQQARLPIQDLLNNLKDLPSAKESAAMAENLLVSPGRFSTLMRLAKLSMEK